MLKMFKLSIALSIPLLAMGINQAKADYMPGESGYAQFVKNTPPQIDNANLQKNSTMVCYATFCSYESGMLRIPVYSAEHLTAQQVKNARGASRKSLQFFPDPHIKSQYSATLADYSRSGYDRGHMAPWADSADPDCFTLANILPQIPDNNRKLWEAIETSTRYMAEKYGEVYVVSGPIFSQDVAFLKGRVAIPDHLYKAVYVPSLGKTSVYITKNAVGNEWSQISLDDLYKLTHVNVFPELSQSQREMFDLPLPNYHGKKIQIFNGSLFNEKVDITPSGENTFNNSSQSTNTKEKKTSSMKNKINDLFYAHDAIRDTREMRYLMKHY